MSRIPSTEDRLVQYLLGLMPEQESVELEDVYLLDDDLNQELQAAERELMDRYLERTLSESERNRFERFFLSSPGRIEKLRFARALKAYGSKRETTDRAAIVAGKPRPPSLMNSFRSYAGAAAFAVLVIVLGIIAWRSYFFRSPEEQTIIALTKAYKPGRLIESHISSLGYAPMAQNRGEGRNLDLVSLRNAELIALKDLDEHPGARSLHTLGRIYLAGQRFDEALESLRKAAEADPEDPRIQSDLGAALLEDARQNSNLEQRAEELTESSDHLNKALQLNDALLEARFNRALLYEFKYLPQLAKAEWQTYLQGDSISGWADEARNHLALLEKQESRSHVNRERDFEEFVASALAGDEATAWKVLSRNRDRTENTITQRLIDEYVQSGEQGHSVEEGERLRLISLAGRLELERAGDRFIADLAAYYAKSTSAQKRLVAQGRDLRRSAALSYGGTEYEKAAGFYQAAGRVFSHARDECEALASAFWVGASYLRVPDADRALAIAEPLVTLSSRREYKLLLAQSLTSVADALGSKREFSKSLETADQSLKIYESIQDQSGVIRSLQFPVLASQDFGEYYKSIGFALQGLDIAAGFSPEPRETWPFYHQIAFNLNELGRSAAALEFGEYALRLATESRTPLLRSRSYGRLAAIHKRLHNYEDALRNGELALAEARAIEGEKSRMNLIANSTLSLAHLYREMGAFDQARSHYDQAIELHRRMNLQRYGTEEHTGRLLTLVALKDEHAIGEEIKTSIGLLERDREGILEDGSRNSYYDLAQSTYDQAIDFAYSHLNDDRVAFGYSEASRARSLLDLMSSGARLVPAREGVELWAKGQARPLTLAEIQRDMPERSQLLQYSLLDDKVIAWVISRDSFQSTNQPVNAADLTESINAFLTDLAKAPSRDYQETRRIGESLYEILIGPVRANLNPDDVVFIVPDKALNYLPFGALVCPESGRYFVEDCAFELTPSASIMMRCSERAAKQGNPRSERVLAVGNPNFDRSRFHLLPDLPAAAREAESIARLYSASLKLIGPEAEGSRVKAAMLDADVIHFAVHSIADERSPLRSRLLLSRNGTEDGELAAAEVYAMNLRRTRLVVLSACGTGIERFYRGEGAIGIARPFIKAGVPIVVATLWPVASEQTSQLMIDFHRRRKQDGRNVVEALRESQLSMLNSADSRDRDPHTWAAFVSIGGFAGF